MEKRMELSKLAKKHNTDKGPESHDYTSRYELYLDAYRDLEFNLLEIGVYNGGSLKMWEEYFPKANIVAIDIDPSCKKYESERISIHIGDQSDQGFLKSVYKEHKNFEIIIDDGGHSWKQQIVSFETLFPLLRLGGIYFIEDLHTSYRPNSVWSDYEYTGVEYLKNLVDAVNLNGKSFAGYSEIGNQYLNIFERSIDYIHFYKSLSVIGKKTTML